MSSSYSSLDWVLSHWAYFAVHRFICVCVCVHLFNTAYCVRCLYFATFVVLSVQFAVINNKPDRIEG